VSLLDVFLIIVYPFADHLGTASAQLRDHCPDGNIRTPVILTAVDGAYEFRISYCVKYLMMNVKYCYFFASHIIPVRKGCGIMVRRPVRFF
jgi:hypothetical protein